MKGIIMAIAIAAGMAIGGEASGQTREEVNEIIRRAQQIRIADVGQCGKKHAKNLQDVERYYEIQKRIRRTHGWEILNAQINSQQIMEAVCRYINDMK